MKWCEEFLRLIRRHCAFLFESHGFHMVHSEEERKGEYCLVVLENDKCRMKFELEQGLAFCYLGTLEAPFVWGRDVKGVQVWYGCEYFLAFLDGKSSTTDTAAPSKGLTATERSLARTADLLRPRIERIIAAFGPDGPARWMTDYEEYSRKSLEDTKKKYGLK